MKKRINLAAKALVRKDNIIMKKQFCALLLLACY